jgi:hypothetical protein
MMMMMMMMMMITAGNHLAIQGDANFCELLPHPLQNERKKSKVRRTGRDSVQKLSQFEK